MGQLRHKLMRDEAAKRLVAARALRASFDASDSAYLLELLGFELLLKLTFETTCQKPAPTHHRYDEIFAALPIDTQARVLRLAAERSHLADLAACHVNVLKDLGSNFINLRYPYEKYGHLTEEEYLAVGEAWMAAGGDVATADYRYHPEELFALTAALRDVPDGC
jgi:hypothetical protein